MRLTIAYSKIKKRNLVLINNATYQIETLSERPIRQPLTIFRVAVFLVIFRHFQRQIVVERIAAFLVSFPDTECSSYVSNYTRRRG